MSSIERRLSKLEAGAERARKSIRSDEDIISSLETGNWEGTHLDALFRVIEPGALGILLAGSVQLRQRLLDGRQEESPISPITAMCWLVACGQDIPYPRGHDLERWKRSLAGPIGDEKRGKGRNDTLRRMLDAWEGIVKRLFLKHGLERLQDMVRLITDTPEDHSEELLGRFIPRVDETRWRRMVTMVQPLHDLYYFGGFPLLALAEDALEYHTLDNRGHEWTTPVG